MSLLDSLAGALGGSQQGGGSAALIGAVLQQLGGNQGLAGLVQQFQQGGLGELVQSWVGSGQNLPISAQQIEQVLGSGALGQLAQQFGLQPEHLASQLAEQLPTAVDRLTPQGQLPEAGTGGFGDLLGQLSGMLNQR